MLKLESPKGTENETMEIASGAEAIRSVVVTAEMVNAYANLTGDFNPLHFDPEFARQTRFERLIAQGGITTGILHALVAMDLPGPGSVFTKQSWSFPHPAFIGDTLTARGVVKDARPSRGFYQMEFRIVNQDGDEVLTGEATVYRAMPSQAS